MKASNIKNVNIFPKRVVWEKWISWDTINGHTVNGDTVKGYTMYENLSIN